MFLNSILHATQYYRAPTPLPEEWETDIENLEKLNLDAFQIRMSWRWNEKREGEYDFSDVDKLMDFAQKHNRKVIIKFMLECAPQYVFDKYQGHRIGPKGEILHGGATGAFYGGFRPCFTNPQVQAAAVRFVETATKRYAGRRNLLFWNAWNEIRNAPIEECFCPHCRKAFGRYLQNKFGTVEKLNDFYGVAEENFDTIALPVMPHGYWDIFEFKKFKASSELYNWLRFVYDAIRKYDNTHPIISHVGCSSAFQDYLSDMCDDYAVSKAVDGFGTSIPISTKMDNENTRMEYFILNDFLRSIDENYLLYEIYPGLGMYNPQDYDTPYDMRYKLYAALACGAKGFNYWQYRSERVAHEGDCAGLLRMDGTPRPVCKEVTDFGAELKKNNDYFVKAKAKPSEVAIVFDFDSMLMSAIESHCGRIFTFTPSNNDSYYKKAHMGMYQLLQKLNYSVDYIHTKTPELFKKYKVLYFPYYTMLNSSIVEPLQEFIANGGHVIADEGFGLRQPNTWIQPYDIAFKPIATARLLERRKTQGETISFQDTQSKVFPYKSEYRIDGAETLAKLSDGTPALQKITYGKGAFYLSGISLGFSYQKTRSLLWEKLVDGLLTTIGISKYDYADNANGLYEKRLLCEDKEIVFLFNTSTQEKTVPLRGKILYCGVDGTIKNNILSLPPLGIAYVITQ